MESLQKYPLFQIASNISIDNLLNLCQTNKKFSKLCQDDDYWKYRAMHVLGYDLKELPDIVNKKWYMKHIGSVYLFKENKFEFVSSGIKKIFCHEYLRAIIDQNNNLFVYGDGGWLFIMKNAKQIQLEFFSNEDENGVGILNIPGKLFVTDMDHLNDLTDISWKAPGKIDYISEKYLLSNGDLYKWTWDKSVPELNIEEYEMPIQVGKIKSIKAESKYFIYITHNNKLYFASNKNKHLMIDNNVKYATFKSIDKNIYIYWIDDNSNLYMTVGYYNKFEQFIKNKHLLLNNIKKIVPTPTKNFILTTVHDLYEINDNFNSDNYKFISKNVKDVESSGDETLILFLEQYEKPYK